MGCFYSKESTSDGASQAAKRAPTPVLYPSNPPTQPSLSRTFPKRPPPISNYKLNQTPKQATHCGSDGDSSYPVAATFPRTRFPNGAGVIRNVPLEELQHAVPLSVIAPQKSLGRKKAAYEYYPRTDSLSNLEEVLSYYYAGTLNSRRTDFSATGRSGLTVATSDLEDNQSELSTGSGYPLPKFHNVTPSVYSTLSLARNMRLPPSLTRSQTSASLNSSPKSPLPVSPARSDNIMLAQRHHESSPDVIPYRTFPRTLSNPLFFSSPQGVFTPPRSPSNRLKGDLARTEVIKVTSQETVLANVELQVTRVNAGKSSTVLYGSGGVIISKSDAQSQTTLNRSADHINSSSSPTCALCTLPISSGTEIEAMDQWWHPEHSECKVCRALIGTTSFVEIQGFVYCEKHYQRLELGPEEGYQNDEKFKIVDN